MTGKNRRKDKVEYATDELLRRLTAGWRLRKFQRCYLCGSDSVDALRGTASRWSLRYERSQHSVDARMLRLGFKPVRRRGPRGGYRHTVHAWKYTRRPCFATART